MTETEKISQATTTVELQADAGGCVRIHFLDAAGVDLFDAPAWHGGAIPYDFWAAMVGRDSRDVPRFSPPTEQLIHKAAAQAGSSGRRRTRAIVEIGGTLRIA